MAIVSCPECGKKLKIADTSVGKKVKGPCGHVFVADMEGAAAAPPKPAAPTKPAVAPEKVYVSCTECGAKLKVATTSLGKKMKCPKCTAVFVANLPADAPAKKPAPEVVFDDEEPAPKAAGKAKAVVKDDDMDDFLSFAQADAAAETERESSFSDEDDMPKPKGKAKKSWDEDEDEDDMPKPKGKAGKKPGKPTRSGDAKPVYPSRLVPTLLATLLLLVFGGLVGAIFFDINVAKIIGLPEPKQVKAAPPIKIDVVQGKGKGKEAKDKDKDKGPETPDLSPEEKINAAKDQLNGLTAATQTFKLKNGEYPKTLNELVESKPPFLQGKNAIIDPWKQAYQYDPEGPKNDGARPDIWTITPDKELIGNWPKETVDPKDKDKGKEPKVESVKLDGAWKVESAEAMGKPVKEFAGGRFVFADGKISGPEMDKAPYVVDESKNPKWLTVTVAGPEAVKLETIFKVEGDRMWWCFPGPGKDDKPGPRPTSFDAKDAMLVILKRSSDTEAKAKTPGIDHRLSGINLKQIGLALHNFHDANNALPAAIFDGNGKPLLSWRVAILPYIEQQELYQEFDLTKSWDDPHNKKLLAKMPKIYVVPGTDAAKGLTHYRALIGPGTVMEPIKDENGKLAGRNLTQLPDGTSNCIVIVEAKDSTEWTRPDDLPYDPKGPLPKFGVAPDGFNALFADAAVRLIRPTVPDEVLRPYLTCNNGTPRTSLDLKDFPKEKGKDKDDAKDLKDKDKSPDSKDLKDKDKSPDSKDLKDKTPDSEDLKDKDKSPDSKDAKAS